MACQLIPFSSRSLKTRLAQRFVRALNRIDKNTRPITSPSEREMYKRYNKIKFAAYSSMAAAVGSRRAWSRAILRKINRNRTAMHKTLISKRRRRRISSNTRGGGRNPSTDSSSRSHHDVQALDNLRKLVPGGQAMETCTLLDETAHFVVCLASQVQIMRRILDTCNSTA